MPLEILILLAVVLALVIGAGVLFFVFSKWFAVVLILLAVIVFLKATGYV